MQTAEYTLLADVGGTHTRCAVADDTGIKDVVVFHNNNFNSLEALLRDYVSRQVSRHGVADEVILGVAGLVTGNQVQLLNRDWSFSSASICQAVGARHTRLVNDFEALAYSLPMLGEDEIVQSGGDHPSPYATKTVLGPGTGLGVSAVVWTGARWLAMPGEGGHVTLPASNKQEEDLCRYLRERFGHASAERALCGAGLSNIYHFLSGNTLAPEDLGALADTGDQDATETFRLFFDLLASVAGNLALTLGAEGGVYVAGGVVKKSYSRLDHQRFRDIFENKGRYSSYLARIPIYWVTSDIPALAGLSYLRHHAQIGGLAG